MCPAEAAWRAAVTLRPFQSHCNASWRLESWCVSWCDGRLPCKNKTWKNTPPSSFNYTPARWTLSSAHCDQYCGALCPMQWLRTCADRWSHGWSLVSVDASLELRECLEALCWAPECWCVGPQLSLFEGDSSVFCRFSDISNSRVVCESFSLSVHQLSYQIWPQKTTEGPDCWANHWYNPPYSPRAVLIQSEQKSC